MCIRDRAIYYQYIFSLSKFHAAPGVAPIPVSYTHLLQGFRVVGSGSKLGREYPVTAYRLGGRTVSYTHLELLPVPELQQPEQEQDRGHTWGGMEL